MGQSRLNSLSLLCHESGLLQSLDTNSIIDKFSMNKIRKIPKRYFNLSKVKRFVIDLLDSLE